MSLLDNPVVRVPRLPIPPMLRGSPQVTQLSNDGSLSCGSGRCQRSGGCDLSENDKNRKFSIHLQRLDGASGFGVNGGGRVWAGLLRNDFHGFRSFGYLRNVGSKALKSAISLDINALMEGR